MTARIGSFNPSSAARISRAVQAVERAGGGGVIRRGKFDDAGSELARSFDIGFTASGSAWRLTVGPGNAFYWFHNQGAGSAFGYKRVATYNQSTNPDIFNTATDTYYAVYATATRTIGTPDTYALSIAIQAGTSEANAIDSINTAGGGWYGTVYSVIIPLAVVYNGSVVRIMHDGDVYFRDDPAPGSKTLSLSGVWPGWKKILTIGGNSIENKFPMISNGYGTVAGSETHQHGITPGSVTVDVNGDGSTANIATCPTDTGTANYADVLPYLTVNAIEKL